ncbi:putative ribonuclease H-like domain-containing protein [Tanacetum coccineum]|uniref:Ribonuclease H-like domain-containing protein n=1 Tax=Tanacetum coccineum TaxID=301880 RepID=A0ABQ4YPM7_9ASTR
MDDISWNMTSPRWSVSTATRWDTLQGNAEDLGTKIAGTRIKTALEGLYMVDDEVPTNMDLMALSDSEFNLATYKRGLTSVEEQLVFYKKNDVIFCEQLAVLKRDILYKDSEISMLKSELEKLKQEKENNQLKIENFDNASKRLFSPPKLDLSNSGLEEFQQPEFEGYGPKTSKSVSEDITNEVKEFPDAPLVKELVSDDNCMADDEVPTNMALMAFSDSEFNKSGFNLATYKRGLSSIEEQLVFYKKNKVIFCEQLVVLKRDISYKDSEISMLKSELEKLKKEKESNQLKIENFDNASKSLDKLIGSQITDKSRKGVGFVSYNVVPPSYTGLFSPPKLDLSNSGLEEFQQPEFEGYGPKTSKSVSEDVSSEVMESPDAPLVKELVSDDKLEKKTIFPTVAKIEFVKPKQQEKPVRKLVKYAEMYRMTAITIKGKGWNIVLRTVLMKTGLRPLNTARPVNTDHPKTITSRKLMEDMLPLGEEPKEGKLLMCDKKNNILFTNTECFVLSPDLKLADESQVLLKVPRKNNMYSVDMKNIIPKESLTCLVAKDTLDESMLWHRRLGHVKFKTINKLVKENLVRSLPTKRFENDQTCVACLKGKQHKASYKSKIQNPITQPLFMLHMDLFGPIFVSSLMNKKYCLVVTDDYGRFNWVFFLASKDETSGILKSFITEIENLVDKTPQQNGVAEKRNRTLIKAARTILADSNLPTTFWAKAVNTACYVQNRVLVVKPYNKTPYELFRGRTHALSFMRPFRCHVTILNTLDYLGKFDGKCDEGFFVGYSLNSKAFRVYNIRTRKVKENLHIRFLEDKPIIAGDGPKWLFDIDVLTKSMNYVPVVAGTNSNDFVGTEESIGAGHSSKETRSSQDYILMPLWKDGSLFDSSSKNASNDEPQPSSDAGKKDDEGVCKESGIDDQERPENSTQGVNTAGPSINTEPDMFSLGDNATLEATHADFFGDETEVDMSNITTTYPVPSTPNTRIHKDHSLDHVIGEVHSGVQTRRMTKTTNEQRFISAVYEGKTHEYLHTCLFACFLSQVEPKKQCRMSFYSLNCRRFKLRLIYHMARGPLGQSGSTGTRKMREVKGDAKGRWIFISQDKYANEILKKFGFSIVRIASTPMETSKPLLKDANAKDVDVHLYRSMIGSLMYLTSSRPDIIFDDSPFNLEAYTDSDYAGASLDRKSTTGVNPTIYTSCIKQFWATAKAKTVNREVQIQALVDGKKVIITETSVRRALPLKDADVLRLLLGTNLVALWPQLSSVLPETKNSTFPMFLDKQVEGMTKHKQIYVTPSHTKKVFANMNREGKGFSGRVTPLFQTIMVQAPEELGEGSEIPTDSQHTPTIIQPSTSQPQKKQPKRKQRKDTEVPQPSGSTKPVTNEAANAEHVPTHFNDPLFSGEDRLKPNELMELYTKLSKRIIDLENTKTSQDAEITKLNKSRTLGLKRLRKVCRSVQVVSSEDEGLGAQNDASKQGRKITDLDADAEREVEIKKAVSKAEVTTVSAITTTVDELTLAQTLIEIKAAKPKAVTTAVTRPKARGVVVQEPYSFVSMEEAEIKKHMEIVVDEEEIAVDAIQLATKPPIIVDWKIIKEGKMGYFQLIRADGSLSRYSSTIKILQNIDREDLKTLWKLVKAKHGNTRPEEAYERVL